MNKQILVHSIAQVLCLISLLCSCANPQEQVGEPDVTAEDGSIDLEPVDSFLTADLGVDQDLEQED